MDSETTGHVHQIWLSLVQHMPTIGLILGGVIGSILWAARRTFATREYLREMDIRNDRKHQDIEAQVVNINPGLRNAAIPILQYK